MPTLQVDSVQDSTQAKLKESTNNVDPTVYFSKIVADFRSVVVYPTWRGLTWNGEIVNFEYKRHEKRLYMLHGYHYDTGQYEHICELST